MVLHLCLRVECVSITRMTAAMLAKLPEKKSVAFLYCCREYHISCSDCGLSEWDELTLNTATKSSMILQSSLLSFYFLNFNSLFAMMLSIGCWYLSANCIISYVEFHWVTTSQWMRYGLNPSWVQMVRQAGSMIVVEWMIAKDNCQTCNQL